MDYSKKILNKLKLKKKNDRVYYSNSIYSEFSLKDIFILKKLTQKIQK